MIDVNVEKVMNRQKVADAIHASLDEGVNLLNKDSYGPTEHAKMKLLRTMGPHINAGVGMIQQETAQMRVAVVVERMKQLGYNGEQKKLE